MITPLEQNFTDSSIDVAVPVTIDGVAISTLYTAGATMSNPAVGYGVCRFTVIAPDGTIATSNGVPLQDIFCYRHATLSNEGVARIAYGLQAAGEYTVMPFYGVRKTDGSLDWRQLAERTVQIFPKTYAITVSV